MCFDSLFFLSVFCISVLFINLKLFPVGSFLWTKWNNHSCSLLTSWRCLPARTWWLCSVCTEPRWACLAHVKHLGSLAGSAHKSERPPQARPRQWSRWPAWWRWCTLEFHTGTGPGRWASGTRPPFQRPPGWGSRSWGPACSTPACGRGWFSSGPDPNLLTPPAPAGCSEQPPLSGWEFYPQGLGSGEAGPGGALHLSVHFSNQKLQQKNFTQLNKNQHSPKILLSILFTLRKLRSWVTTEESPFPLWGGERRGLKSLFYLRPVENFVKFGLTHGKRAGSCVSLCTWLRWCELLCRWTGSCSSECLWWVWTWGCAGNITYSCW